MAIREKLIELAGVQEEICITISLNTHRIYPDRAVDPILLKDLIKEASNRLKDEYEKKNNLFTGETKKDTGKD
ncbi:MAG: hypothetical protein LUD02_06695 [Tannerellaceae bacterium]|nr:hypothetical protein [Tannerellaceae bacterium]